MYVCGPTVYGHSHLGHGKSYVSFDVIVRHLYYCGYQAKLMSGAEVTEAGLRSARELMGVK